MIPVPYGTDDHRVQICFTLCHLPLTIEMNSFHPSKRIYLGHKYTNKPLTSSDFYRVINNKIKVLIVLYLVFLVLFEKFRYYGMSFSVLKLNIVINVAKKIGKNFSFSENKSCIELKGVLNMELDRS